MDIGIGDVVVGKNLTIKLIRTNKRALFESELSLLVYPAESIFAEKLETACFRGIENSRMKDFHDMWLMLFTDDPLIKDRSNLFRAMKETFAHRDTKLQLIPIASYDDLNKQEKYWQAHLKALKRSPIIDQLPKHFISLVEQINSWLSDNFGLDADLSEDSET